MSISEITKEFNQFAEELANKGKEKFKEVFKIFWDANPNVNVIVWTQYAPYFNDGDACVFNVHGLSFSNLTDESEFRSLAWGEYEGDDENIWCIDSYCIVEPHQADKEMVKELSKFIKSESMENIMKLMFGDDSIVFATREGFRSEHYEHE